MNQMRMGTAMTAALLEGQMGIDLVIGHFVGKPANDVRQQMGIIGDLNVFLIDLAAAVLVLPNQIPAEHHMFVAVELIPLKGLVFTIDIKAFAVATGDMVQEALHFNGRLAILQGHQSRLKGEGQPYCFSSSGRTLPEPLPKTLTGRCPARAKQGPMAWVGCARGGKPSQ